MAKNGFVSRVHCKKLPNRPCRPTSRERTGANRKVRAAVEHVLAHQKGPMGLVERRIGLARARVKIGLANLVYNMKRLVWLTAGPVIG